MAALVEWLGTHRRRQPQGACERRQCQYQPIEARAGPLRASNRHPLRRQPWKRSYIVGAARTPIGKFGGSLAKTPASDLGALVIRKVLERAGVRAGAGVAK